MSIDDNVFSCIERFHLPRWRSYINTAFALGGTIPLQVAYYRHRHYIQRARDLMHSHDGVLAHLIRSGDGARTLPGKKFLEMTDAISLNYSRVREDNSRRHDLRAVLYAIESRRLIGYERRIVDDFDHSFLVSDIDRQFLFSHQPERLQHVSVCSNGVDLTNLPFQFNHLGLDIVFIGNLFSLQNYDGAYFFAKEVLPLVRAQLPSVKFRIIGRIRAEQAKILSKFEGVEVTGEVKSVATAARLAGVGVCSIRLGAGVQNKILEYMALGLPVVSTSVGLEGLSAHPGRDLLIANDAISMSDAVVTLLINRSQAAEIAESARKYVETSHSWETILQPLGETIVESIAA